MWVSFFLLFLGRNRIKASTAKRIATEDSKNGKIETFEGSVNPDGFNGILGTSGRETANAVKKIGVDFLVNPNGKDEQVFHDSADFHTQPIFSKIF